MTVIGRLLFCSNTQEHCQTFFSLVYFLKAIDGGLTGKMAYALPAISPLPVGVAVGVVWQVKQKMEASLEKVVSLTGRCNDCKNCNFDT